MISLTWRLIIIIINKKHGDIYLYASQKYIAFAIMVLHVSTIIAALNVGCDDHGAYYMSDDH